MGGEEGRESGECITITECNSLHPPLPPSLNTPLYIFNHSLTPFSSPGYLRPPGSEFWGRGERDGERKRGRDEEEEEGGGGGGKRGRKEGRGRLEEEEEEFFYSQRKQRRRRKRKGKKMREGEEEEDDDERRRRR